MEKYTLTKLPDSVTHVFIDSDSIAYKGACVVEKAKYNMSINSQQKNLIRLIMQKML